MEAYVKKFNELSLEELYEILRLRSEVFVVEQDCVYQDIDGKDKDALHVYISENGKILAYTRCFPPGFYFNEAAIGRVVVEASARNSGIGQDIMKSSIKAIEKNFKTGQITLSAQTYLINFYNRLGFKETGNEYLEDGIPHIKMTRS